jgi:tetratricopeptide (TPR) repeat protein
MRLKNFGIRLLVLFSLLFLLSIPVSAYSSGAVALYDQGNAFVLSKNYTLANDAFDHAIALEPGYFEAWDRKADALNRAGQFSDALQASSRSLEINPNYIKGWINRGQILYNIGYYYEDIEHNQAKANDYYQQQVLAFEKAIELDPSNPEAWFNKGYALAGLKRYDEAIAAFDKVQSLNPNYPNLGLSQKQARVLRDAATPAYVKYALPLAGGLLILVILIGIYWYRLLSGDDEEDSAPDNRKSRRKKEQ